MSFKDQIKDDVKNCILNTNEFAEDVIYTPKNGVAKEIKAFVNRQPPAPDNSASSRVLENQFEVTIANDDTAGVTSISLGGDTINFPKYAEGAKSDWLVTAIIAQDEAMWRLLVTR